MRLHKPRQSFTEDVHPGARRTHELDLPSGSSQSLLPRTLRGSHRLERRVEVQIDEILRDVESRDSELQLYDAGRGDEDEVTRTGSGQRGIIAQTRAGNLDVAPRNLEDPELRDTLLFPRGRTDRRAPWASRVWVVFRHARRRRLAERRVV